jgi:NadR type nicotinamide-nucleotide adenylyltransferase
MIKVAIIGPESAGKTTLAGMLKVHYNGFIVNEFAREYLNDKSSYEEEDLLEIAKGQANLEDEGINSDKNIVLFDTNFLVLKVWSVLRYNRCHSFIEEELSNRNYDLTLLLLPNIPWQYDPMRESPSIEDRMNIFNEYRKQLELLKHPYQIIRNIGYGRTQESIYHIDELVASQNRL